MYGLYSVEEDVDRAIAAVEQVFGMLCNGYWEQMPMAPSSRGLVGPNAIMPSASLTMLISWTRFQWPLAKGRWTVRGYATGRHSLLAVWGMPVYEEPEPHSDLFSVAINVASVMHKSHTHDVRYGPFFAEFPTLMLNVGVRCLPTVTGWDLEGLVADDNFTSR